MNPDADYIVKCKKCLRHVFLNDLGNHECSIRFKYMKWTERVLWGLIGSFFGYIPLVILTDIRIDRLRPFVSAGAIEEGVTAGIDAYKKEYIKDEKLYVRKRKARDEEVRRYIKKLNDFMGKEF